MSSAARKGSVKCCVLCSSVLICEKKNILETRCVVFSLTELTEFTEFFGAQFRAHRRPPAYREHRAFLLKMAVRFCEFCRPQGLCEMLCVLFFCTNLWEKEYFRDSLRSFFSHRTHRFNRSFWRTISNPQKAFGIQNSQSVSAKDGCKVLCYQLT